MGLSQVYASDKKIDNRQAQLLLETEQLLDAVEKNILLDLKKEEKEIQDEEQTKIDRSTGSAINESQLVAERNTIETKQTQLATKINRWRRYDIDFLSLIKINDGKVMKNDQDMRGTGKEPPQVSWRIICSGAPCLTLTKGRSYVSTTSSRYQSFSCTPPDRQRSGLRMPSSWMSFL